MNLEQLQRAVFEVIRQPLTPSENMRPTMPDGRSTQEVVEQIIKPNDRLTSFERLEIYNRVYWFRLLSSLAEDFPGLRAIVGQQNFDKLLVAYLTEYPSESFTLRNLGSRMEMWLRKHPEFTPKKERLALDMVRLEWADIEVFDSDELPKLSADDLGGLGDDPSFRLQPYLRLLDLAYPVDDLLLSVREGDEQESDIASHVVLEHTPRRSKRIRLPKPKNIYLAVHRQENVVYFKRIQAEAFALLRALQEGKPLSAAIEGAVSQTNHRLEKITGQIHSWFANWAALGWFTASHSSKTAMSGAPADSKEDGQA
jgi:Putative DNA-binding domain